ncbi:MAG TPA: zinc-dependent peptidase [Candidatus Hydrogenedentes bacterium]|nr:zinc-dependent peptidase [Candidatus Hydrogenedentota bacterium]HPG69856.1 zinc-dependent peptidase [Candidatus Hydrogenedentota bacterium]
MSGFLARRRRERLRREPFPQTWVDIIRAGVPYYSLLTDPEQRILQGHIQVFLAEKHFFGCHEVEITDEMRLVIAAQACLLILNVDADYFPRLQSVLVYRDSFKVERQRRNRDGIVSEWNETLVGESWDLGAVILSWHEVERDAHTFDGRNVVLHEFAHQMDQDDGTADGWPGCLERTLNKRWLQVMSREYQSLVEAVCQGRHTFINPYGAKKPSEFFAVVTETFFERPWELCQQHRQLYDVFALFYRQDPITRFPPSAA